MRTGPRPSGRGIPGTVATKRLKTAAGIVLPTADAHVTRSAVESADEDEISRRSTSCSKYTSDGVARRFSWRCSRSVNVLDPLPAGYHAGSDCLRRPTGNDKCIQRKYHCWRKVSAQPRSKNADFRRPHCSPLSGGGATKHGSRGVGSRRLGSRRGVEYAGDEIAARDSPMSRKDGSGDGPQRVCQRVRTAPPRQRTTCVDVLVAFQVTDLSVDVIIVAEPRGRRMRRRRAYHYISLVTRSLPRGGASRRRAGDAVMVSQQLKLRAAGEFIAVSPAQRGLKNR